MSIDNLNAIINRAATDLTFRERLFAHRDQVGTEYGLSPQAKETLRHVTPAMIEEMLDKLDDWNQPAAGASMELLFLLYPQVLPKPGGRISGAVPNRLVIIAGGVAVLVVVVIIVALLSGGKNNSNAQGSGANLTCGEACADTNQCADGLRCQDGKCFDAAACGGEPTSPSLICTCTCTEDCSGATCITTCADCNGNRCIP